MKPEELQIGDWVLYKSDAPENAFPIKVDYNIFCNELHKWEDRFEAIQLTPEILEKNGFEKVNESVFRIYNYSAKLHIGIYFDEFRDNMPIIYLLDENTGSWPGYQQYDLFDCKYVHELQHALRLCKIDKEIIL